MSRIRNSDKTRAYFTDAGVDQDISRRVVDNLLDGLPFIAVTGKLASGKDTIAPRVLDLVNFYDNVTPFHAYFASALKTEVTHAMDSLRNSNLIARNSGLVDVSVIDTSDDWNEMSKTLVSDHDITAEEADFVLRHLVPEFCSDNPPVDGWSRTPHVRRVLQYWGTDIRRKYDENYWVKKTTRNIAEVLANGTPVYVTDARFVNEADALALMGCFVGRLDITKETQDRRLFNRDGLALPDEARYHVSETALDDYRGFHVRVDNNDDGDGSSPDENPAVKKVVKQFTQAYKGTESF